MFDIRLHIAILGFLVLNEAEKALVDGNLQLLVIIGVLDNLVDGILEVIDLCIVIADVVTVCSNSLGNQCLTNSEVLDHETERGVDRVKLGQLLVKFLCLHFQAIHLAFFRSNILPEVTNLLVKNEFELLKLLSLLLKV